MLVNVRNFVSRGVVAALLCSAAWAQTEGAAQAQGQAAPASGPQWKDRAEFDLVETIGKTTDPVKKIALLDQWKEKYPNTDFKKQRTGMYLGAYQQSKNLPKMAESANELMDMDPKDVQVHAGLVTLALQTQSTSPEMLGVVEKASKGVISNIDNKPANVTDEQWKTQRNALLGFSYKSLGYVSQTRKDTPGMIENYTKSLEADPNQGTLSYALGQAILGQKDEQTYPVGLYHVARAVVYEGPNSLSTGDKTKINDYLTKAYEGFHGDKTGLDQVKTTAKANAVPPSGFTIRSVKEIANDKMKADQALAESNPKLAMWTRIKEELKGENGETYFDGSMKDAKTPDLMGYVVEQRSKELVLALSDKTTPEVTLQFEAAITGKVEPGTQIDFSAISKTFTKDPFMIMMEADKADVKGLPAAAPAKKPARSKRRK